MEDKSLILADDQVRQKIKRMAYEIYENNFQEKEVILAGIHEQGYQLARLIQSDLTKIASFKQNGFLLIRGLIPEEELTQPDKDSINLIKRGSNGSFGDDRYNYVNENNERSLKDNNSIINYIAYFL